MKCKHCSRDIVEYKPLGYCENCKAWYKEEGEEEEGVYFYCTTKDTDPENCNKFVQSLIMRAGKAPDGKNMPHPDITIGNVRLADKICAACKNKNFVLE